MSGQENEFNGDSPDKEELDPLEITAVMTFIRDYPGIDDNDRERLLNSFEDPSTRGYTIKESKEIVEGVLREGLQRDGAGTDWEYSFKFAPYDMFTGEQLPIPMVWAKATSREGKEELKKSGFLPNDLNMSTGRLFFANEFAWDQYDERGYNRPLDQRPPSAPPPQSQ